MKRLIYSSLTSVIILSSCNNSNQPLETGANDTVAKKEEMKIQVPDQACYIGTQEKDTIQLVVERFPNVVTGRLFYNFNEKDDNKGTFDGKLFGDTLIADYTFISEGKSSVREIAFLLRDSTATEGYGPVEEKDGKMVITDRSQLNFKNAVALNRTSCMEK